MFLNFQELTIYYEEDLHSRCRIFPTHTAR